MTTRHGRWLRLLACAVTLAAAPASAATTSVFYCGQSFRGRGILTTNLDCTGCGGPGVTIERGHLDLNGFHITGAGQFGIHCLSTCQIRGPGSISNNTLDGIRADGWVGLESVTISSNGADGVTARSISNASRVIVSRSSIVNNGFNGISSDNLVTLRRSTVTGNGEQGVDLGVPA